MKISIGNYYKQLEDRYQAKYDKQLEIIMTNKDIENPLETFKIFNDLIERSIDFNMLTIDKNSIYIEKMVKNLLNELKTKTAQELEDFSFVNLTDNISVISKVFRKPELEMKVHSQMIDMLLKEENSDNLEAYYRCLPLDKYVSYLLNSNKKKLSAKELLVFKNENISFSFENQKELDKFERELDLLSSIEGIKKEKEIKELKINLRLARKIAEFNSLEANYAAIKNYIYGDKGVLGEFEYLKSQKSSLEEKQLMIDKGLFENYFLNSLSEIPDLFSKVINGELKLNEETIKEIIENIPKTKEEEKKVEKKELKQLYTYLIGLKPQDVLISSFGNYRDFLNEVKSKSKIEIIRDCILSEVEIEDLVFNDDDYKELDKLIKDKQELPLLKMLDLGILKKNQEHYKKIALYQIEKVNYLNCESKKDYRLKRKVVFLAERIMKGLLNPLGENGEINKEALKEIGDVLGKSFVSKEETIHTLSEKLEKEWGLDSKLKKAINLFKYGEEIKFSRVIDLILKFQDEGCLLEFQNEDFLVDLCMSSLQRLENEEEGSYSFYFTLNVETLVKKLTLETKEDVEKAWSLLNKIKEGYKSQEDKLKILNIEFYDLNPLFILLDMDTKGIREYFSYEKLEELSKEYQEDRCKLRKITDQENNKISKVLKDISKNSNKIQNQMKMKEIEKELEKKNQKKEILAIFEDSFFIKKEMMSFYKKIKEEDLLKDKKLVEDIGKKLEDYIIEDIEYLIENEEYIFEVFGNIDFEKILASKKREKEERQVFGQLIYKIKRKNNLSNSDEDKEEIIKYLKKYLPNKENVKKIIKQYLIQGARGVEYDLLEDKEVKWEALNEFILEEPEYFYREKVGNKIGIGVNTIKKEEVLKLLTKESKERLIEQSLKENAWSFPDMLLSTLQLFPENEQIIQSIIKNYRNLSLERIGSASDLFAEEELKYKYEASMNRINEEIKMKIESKEVFNEEIVIEAKFKDVPEEDKEKIISLIRKRNGNLVDFDFENEFMRDFLKYANVFYVKEEGKVVGVDFILDDPESLYYKKYFEIVNEEIGDYKLAISRFKSFNKHREKTITDLITKKMINYLEEQDIEAMYYSDKISHFYKNKSRRGALEYNRKNSQSQKGFQKSVNLRPMYAEKGGKRGYPHWRKEDDFNNMEEHYYYNFVTKEDYEEVKKSIEEQEQDEYNKYTKKSKDSIYNYEVFEEKAKEEMNKEEVSERRVKKILMDTPDFFWKIDEKEKLNILRICFELSGKVEVGNENPIREFFIYRLLRDYFDEENDLKEKELFSLFLKVLKEKDSSYEEKVDNIMLISSLGIENHRNLLEYSEEVSKTLKPEDLKIYINSLRESLVKEKVFEASFNEVINNKTFNYLMSILNIEGNKNFTKTLLSNLRNLILESEDSYAAIQILEGKYPKISHILQDIKEEAIIDKNTVVDIVDVIEDTNYDMSIDKVNLELFSDLELVLLNPNRMGDKVREVYEEIFNNDYNFQYLEKEYMNFKQENVKQIQKIQKLSEEIEESESSEKLLEEVINKKRIIEEILKQSYLDVNLKMKIFLECIDSSIIEGFIEQKEIIKSGTDKNQQGFWDFASEHLEKSMKELNDNNFDFEKYKKIIESIKEGEVTEEIKKGKKLKTIKRNFNSIEEIEKHSGYKFDFKFNAEQDFFKLSLLLKEDINESSSSVKKDICSYLNPDDFEVIFKDNLKVSGIVKKQSKMKDVLRVLSNEQGTFLEDLDSKYNEEVINMFLLNFPQTNKEETIYTSNLNNAGKITFVNKLYKLSKLEKVKPEIIHLEYNEENESKIDKILESYPDLNSYKKGIINKLIKENLQRTIPEKREDLIYYFSLFTFSQLHSLDLKSAKKVPSLYKVKFLKEYLKYIKKEQIEDYSEFKMLFESMEEIYELEKENGKEIYSPSYKIDFEILKSQLLAMSIRTEYPELRKPLLQALNSASANEVSSIERISTNKMDIYDQYRETQLENEYMSPRIPLTKSLKEIINPKTGEKEFYVLEMIHSLDPRVLFTGEATDCCRVANGVGSSHIDFEVENPEITSTMLYSKLKRNTTEEEISKLKEEIEKYNTLLLKEGNEEEIVFGSHYDTIYKSLLKNSLIVGMGSSWKNKEQITLNNVEARKVEEAQELDTQIKIEGKKVFRIEEGEKTLLGEGELSNNAVILKGEEGEVQIQISLDSNVNGVYRELRTIRVSEIAEQIIELNKQYVKDLKEYVNNLLLNDENIEKYADYLKAKEKEGYIEEDYQDIVIIAESLLSNLPMYISMGSEYGSNIVKKNYTKLKNPRSIPMRKALNGKDIYTDTLNQLLIGGYKDGDFNWSNSINISKNREKSSLERIRELMELRERLLISKEKEIIIKEEKKRERTNIK